VTETQRAAIKRAKGNLAIIEQTLAIGLKQVNLAMLKNNTEAASVAAVAVFKLAIKDVQDAVRELASDA